MRPTTGEKIAQLRKLNGYTQEQLAELMNVSRQSVSKWEQDIAYPETDKLIALASLFGTTVDEILRPQEAKPTQDDVVRRNDFHFEYKSKRTLWGLPLVHINLGLGLYKAKGIVAIGNLSCGVLSVGALSLGGISFGALSLGIFSLGAFAAGLVSLGSIALGLIALGAVAVGLYSLGAASVGLFSAGALAVGQYVAVGDYAYSACVAVGKTFAKGQYTFLPPYGGVLRAVEENVPKFWELFRRWIEAIIASL